MSTAALMRTPLSTESDPFLPGIQGPRIGGPLQKAFSEVLHQISLQAPLVLVIGAAGTGKTLLSVMVSRTCSETGLSVRCVARGDMAHWALGEPSDVLLIDEADSVTDSFFEGLPSEGRVRSVRTTVFLGLPASAARFDLLGLHPVVVELTPLTAPASQRYLLEMATSAGFPGLFTAEALDAIVHESRGTPRLLRSMASFAFFVASSDGASQISLRHVGHAGATQVHLGGRKAGGNTQPTLCDIETLVATQEIEHTPADHEDNHEIAPDECTDKTCVDAQRDLSPSDTLNIGGNALPALCEAEAPDEAQRKPFASLDAHKSDESALLLREHERLVDAERETSVPAHDGNADESLLVLRREDEGLLEGHEEPSVPSAAHEAEETTPLLLRDDEVLIENQGSQERDDLRSTRLAAGRRKTRRRQSDDTTISQRELLIIAAVVIAASFTFVAVLPSILTRVGPESAVSPRTFSVPVQPLPSDEFRFVAPPPVPAPDAAPALLPPTSSEAAANSASNKFEGIAQTEETGVAQTEGTDADQSGAGGLLLPSAKGEATGRSALTEAEKKAVARGIEELKRAAAQAKAKTK